jgi:hypothetical protein
MSSGDEAYFTRSGTYTHRRKFSRLTDANRGLLDWDERPSGRVFSKKTIATYLRPPYITLLGETRTHIIYAPTKNWFTWSRCYPKMLKDFFLKNYKEVEQIPAFCKQCPDCGFNTVYAKVCLKCLRELELAVKRGQY